MTTVGLTSRHRRAEARVPRQGRSEDAIAKIAKAVISLLASEGQGAITHRRVAEVAGVSVAATTYYYSSKFALIADAQARLLDAYVNAFVRARERHRAGEPVVANLPALVIKLLKNAAGRHGSETLAWSEIMLDCTRDERGHALAKEWFSRMENIWSELLTEFGTPDAAALVNPAIDTVVGLLFITLPLQLSEEQIALVLEEGQPLSSVCGHLRNDIEARQSANVEPGKSGDARARIVDAAVRLLESGDAQAVTYGAVARRAGLTNAAPAYHFARIDELSDLAQSELLRRMKERYEAMLIAAAGADVPAGDLLATIHVRSVLEDGTANMAGHQAWLSAVRRSSLRAAVADIVLAFEADFAALLGTPDTSRATILIMAQFVGRGLRIQATGKPTVHMACARQEFERTIGAALRGQHPMLPE
ncbi:TetR/AcrR family transcriptional regulator [Sphingomonas sp. Root710]|uniref:TetR/AcrR family transcriptional regulator n=1 Tax=Sphingomonas sp. Root710 TaxID=1736594 RepID=UPI00138EDD3C|nr:hypothetical protein [Sphingomonas sp. Root710]